MSDSQTHQPVRAAYSPWVLWGVLVVPIIAIPIVVIAQSPDGAQQPPAKTQSTQTQQVPTHPKRPISDPNILELPELPKIELPKIESPSSRPSAVEDRIRDTLEGKAAGDTGDVVLDDMLRVLQQRGSVLKGSLLEASHSEHRHNTHDGQPNDPTSTMRQRSRAAESLLKSARLLENLRQDDSTQTDLIDSMRRQAAVLIAPMIQRTSD
ncbi:MAG: hypothetical protein HKN47_13345 [Pirellulaceae bacterium]|nr:hypothetical protein [Pirellulaceae bacterium]